MKAKGLAVLCIAMLVACTGAFAGTATFSGSNGDVDAQLIGLGVSYQQCLIEVAADGWADLSGVTNLYPSMGVDPLMLSIELATNSAESATDYVGVQIDLFSSDTPAQKGNLLVTVDMDSVDLFYTPAIGAQEQLFSAPASGVKAFTIDVTEEGLTSAELTVSYDAGAGAVVAGSIDLSSFGSGNVNAVALGAEYRCVYTIVTNVEGPSWYLNQVQWIGDAVVDLNAAGAHCDAYIVPSVVGLHRTEAPAIIEAAGLTVGTLSYQISGTVPQNHIISQSPEAGLSAVPGSPVNLVISIGATDSDQDGLPDDWELEVFGSIEAYVAFDDADNDGHHNLEEYRDGTDPLDPFSALPVSSPVTLLVLGLATAAAGAVVIRRRRSA